MSHYQINISSKLNEGQLNKGLFIYMFRASRIPPHLGIIYNGKLFDITFNGPNNGLDAGDFIQEVLRKYTKTVFIELELPVFPQNIESNIREKIMRYECVTDTISCLNPIKDFIAEAYHIDVSSVNFIFDLLPILQSLNIVNNSFHLNLDRNIQNGIFQLTKYTQEDIDKCMEALNRKEVVC